ncbi:Gfo/Idh/MocA family oxidoreductase [Rhabdobacter roseus]|uniref:Putative dehydrogenase n=1 Tax=Rhabdobacter roseus TaxID=1655419 RepID=A0A840U2C1_9BACT|nr:Gfo/Idh/MocA family oxidoreductase [Rhabdobacter roseus]MBB5286508.1 putative dehydrogenase [Rhabdobacter roseus]
MSTKILNVGLIGFGLSGRYFHAPFLAVNPRFRLKKVVERSKNEAQDFDPSIENARSVDELLSDKSIDVVFICTPNDTHFAYAQEALENGKHVVIEKPFANTEAEARQLVELAAQKKLIITGYQNRRWDSDFLTIQKLMADDTMGEIVEFESRYDRYRPVAQTNTWKEQSGDGGGNLYNLGPHLVDQALVLFGPPAAVSAEVKTLREGSLIDDFFAIRLHYPDKSVLVKSSLLVYDNSFRYILHGTKGSYLKTGLDVQEETLRQNVLPDASPWGEEPEDRWGKLSTDAYSGIHKSLPGNYMPFYDNIYDAIVLGKELAVKPEEVLRTTRVIDLAWQSSRERVILAF